MAVLQAMQTDLGGPSSCPSLPNHTRPPMHSDKLPYVGRSLPPSSGSLPYLGLSTNHSDPPWPRGGLAGTSTWSSPVCVRAGTQGERSQVGDECKASPTQLSVDYSRKRGRAAGISPQECQQRAVCLAGRRWPSHLTLSLLPQAPRTPRRKAGATGSTCRDAARAALALAPWRLTATQALVSVAYFLTQDGK